MRFFLSCLFFFAINSVAAPIEVESYRQRLDDLVITVSKLTGTPIFIAEGVDSSVTVVNKRLRRADALPYLTTVVEQAGYQVTRDRGSLFIKPVDENADEPKPAMPGQVTRVYRVRPERIAEVSTAVETMAGHMGDVARYVADVQIPGVTVTTAADSVVVTATPEQHAEIKAVITVLDQPSAQVQIEALIFETSNLEFEAMGFSARSLSDGLTFSIGLADELNVVVPGVGIGFQSNGSIRGVAQLIETQNDSRVLSTPVVRAVDRQASRFQVGQEVPFIVSTSTADDGRVTQQLERKTVGLTMEVTPTIHDDVVRMAFRLTTGSLTDDSRAADVITNNRELETTIEANDGELVYLGGLTQTDQRSNATGVPVLSDVPVIGSFFGHDDDRRNETKLSVFLKPTILTSR